MAGSAVLILVVLLLVVAIGAAFLFVGGSSKDSESNKLSIANMIDQKFYFCSSNGTCEDGAAAGRMTFKEHTTRDDAIFGIHSNGSKTLFVLRKSADPTVIKLDNYTSGTESGNPAYSFVLKLNKKGLLTLTDRGSGNQWVQE